MFLGKTYKIVSRLNENVYTVSFSQCLAFQNAQLYLCHRCCYFTEREEKTLLSAIVLSSQTVLEESKIVYILYVFNWSEQQNEVCDLSDQPIEWQRAQLRRNKIILIVNVPIFPFSVAVVCCQDRISIRLCLMHCIEIVLHPPVTTRRLNSLRNNQ